MLTEPVASAEARSLRRWILRAVLPRMWRQAVALLLVLLAVMLYRAVYEADIGADLVHFL